MRNNFILILLVLCISSVHAKSTFYRSSSNLLFVPEVEIDGHIYIDGVLSLMENGKYRVNGLTALEPAQESLLKKINSIPCGQADTLGRFSAYMSFINGNTAYCLVKTQLITVEGGRILSYLFIENGLASIIIDARNDTFRGCCRHLYDAQYNGIQFGYIKDDIFVEQSTLTDIDFERDYILKLIGNGVENGSY